MLHFIVFYGIPEKVFKIKKSPNNVILMIKNSNASVFRTQIAQI